MRILVIVVAVFQLFMQMPVSGQETMPLREDGTVPVWLTNGPFEIETTGFGDMSERNAIDETNSLPKYGMTENNPVIAGGKTVWNYTSALENGYTDLNEYYGWQTLTSTEKIWYQKIVYASALLNSDQERTADLKFGGNTVIQVFLNGEEIYRSLQAVNAAKDNFTQKVTLRKGENRLLVKTAASHRNHGFSFFIPLEYKWGFFMRITDENGKKIDGVSLQNRNTALKTAFAIKPTFFYKKENGKSKQKYIVTLTSADLNNKSAVLSFTAGKEKFSFRFNDLKFGLNLREIFVPEPRGTQQITAQLEAGSAKAESSFSYTALPKYELYYMPSTHMDIGYTNTQPVVIERQLAALDQVIDKCRSDKEFKWTIETMWLLENYRLSRSSDKFNYLVSLIKNGRVAVSPLYSNPFTGWISESELEKSFSKAAEYKAKYGISYSAAIYNDVPGQSSALPQALRNAGAKVLVNGINEIFSNYKFQKSLPKVFKWAGSSADTVLMYLSEAYTEGLRFGLERDSTVIANRMWHTINNLKDRDYPFNKVLIIGVFTDNAGIAFDQYKNAVEWNKKYEYPKFIISTLDDFSAALQKENTARLKTIKGDWTSDWDILNQGEVKRFLKYRWVQNNLPSAEILASAAHLENLNANSFAEKINSVYDDMLHFSGHGSGLEYGYGSRLENKLTEDYREGYVQNSLLKTREILERSAYRLTAPKESFDSHGVIVFNTLTWERTIPVEIQLPETDLNNYSVMDLSANRKINSFRKDDKIWFTAPAVPGIGYKQFELVNEAAQAGSSSADDGAIENEYYRISLSDNMVSISDKKTGKELFSGSSIRPFLPVIKKTQLNEEFSPAADKITKTGILKNEVFEEISAGYNNNTFEKITIRLWKGVNRADVSVSVNLSSIKEPEKTENYGLAFPLNAGSSVKFETLGGMTGPAGRFEAAQQSAFAIRRAVEISDAGRQIIISSPDCRIFSIDSVKGSRLLTANVLNNFPSSWNRNQELDGSIDFKFSIMSSEGGKADASAFGYETASDAVVRRSWYKKNEPVKKYLELSNKAVKMVSFAPADENAFEIILQNTDPVNAQQTAITSALLFGSSDVSEVSLTGEVISRIKAEKNKIDVKLSPESFKKIMVKVNHVSQSN